MTITCFANPLFILTVTRSLPKNNTNYPVPENTYINGVLEKGTKFNEYKLIKKDVKDKKMRIELSANSGDIDYTIFYEDNKKPDYLEQINLGKIIIDVFLTEYLIEISTFSWKRLPWKIKKF